MRIFIIINILLIFLAVNLNAEDYKEINDLGVKAYNNENYDSSLQYFQDAQELSPTDKVIDFNLGNALHQQGMYEQALQNYENSINVEDSMFSAQAYHNIGNTQFRAGALDKAVEAYKKSLDYNPDDKDTKYNLELAMKKLEEQPMQLDEKRAQALLEGLIEDEKEVLKKLIQQKVGVSSYKGKNW